MWAIFKVICWICYSLAFPVYVLTFWPQGMWSPSSPTRVQTHTPFIRRRSPNLWNAREIPLFCFVFSFLTLHLLLLALSLSICVISWGVGIVIEGIKRSSRSFCLCLCVGKCGCFLYIGDAARAHSLLVLNQVESLLLVANSLFVWSLWWRGPDFCVIAMSLSFPWAPVVSDWKI